jgi:hypothetical protein
MFLHNQISSIKSGELHDQLSSTDSFTRVLTEMRWSTVVSQQCLFWPGEEHLPKEMVAHPLRSAGTLLSNVHQEQLVISKTEMHVQ